MHILRVQGLHQRQSTWTILYSKSETACGSFQVHALLESVAITVQGQTLTFAAMQAPTMLTLAPCYQPANLMPLCRPCPFSGSKQALLFLTALVWWLLS